MGCGSSNSRNTTTAGERVPDEPLQTSKLNNNVSTIPVKNVSEEQGSGASRETTEADQRAADVQKEMYVVETKTASKSQDLTIVHFNDVYNIEPREKEPVGGAARFATKLASFRHLNPLTVFSGDCLNPSSMSSVTGGKQMIPILNALNVNIAVFGNHDFDFGVDELMEFSAATTFPWLLSNVIDNVTGKQLAGGEVKRIMEWDGRKIGFMGLVEEEWLVTLATVDREEVTYLDFVTEGTKLAKELREEGVEFVVALTHMRGPNDCRLAEQAAGIDLILGGHDHDYFAQKINGVQVLKSGTDFREFSLITVSFNSNNTFSLNIQKIEITSDIPEDPEVKATVDKFVGVMNEMMEETIGELEVELDGRFASIRRKETNLGNFITDIILNVTEVDCVMLNSGTLRSDSIHPRGKFKMKDLSAILPMPDVLVVLELSGDQILEALENGVSQWPKLEGRFPQIAGMKFSFNPKRDPGNRVLKNSVTVNDEPLQKNKKYKVCTKSYIARGKDGYQVFTKAKVLVDEEDGPILSTIVRNHFHSINIVRGVTKSKSSHRQSLIMTSKECLNSGQEGKENGCHDATQHAHWRHRSSDMIDGGQGSSQDIFLDLEKEHASISPKVEGRITVVDEEDEVTRLAHSNSLEDVTLNAVQVHGEHKPLGGETRPSDTEGGGKEDCHIQTEGENSVRNSKQAVEKSLPFSDKPAGQELPQSEGSLADQTETPARGQKFRGDNKQVKQERNDEKNQGDAESNQETANDVTKGGKDQGKQGKAVEKINRNDEQNRQDPQEESSKNQPSKAESERFQPDQEMGGASQLLGPDLATEDEYWDLWEAVKVDDIDVVRNLRKEKNIRFSRFQDNKTILHLGAERNSSRVVAYLLTEGRVDPNVKDEILQGVPLHGAAEYGSVNTAKVLLEHGAEINKQDLIGNTALHIACEHDQGEMKIFLVNQGADTTVVNSDGETPAL